MLAAQLPDVRERFRGIEQFLQRVDADHSGALEHRVIDRVASHQRAGVGARGACPGGEPSSLHHDHRFHARCGACGGHELARTGHGLHVEQDRAGTGVVGEVVEHVAEIDIAHVAERHDVRKADVARLRPIDHRGHDGARLGHERQLPAARGQVREAGIERYRGRHQAEAVRTHDAQHVRARGVEHPGVGRRGFLAVAENRADHDRGARAARAELAR